MKHRWIDLVDLLMEKKMYKRSMQQRLRLARDVRPADLASEALLLNHHMRYVRRCVFFCSHQLIVMCARVHVSSRGECSVYGWIVDAPCVCKKPRPTLESWLTCSSRFLIGQSNPRLTGRGLYKKVCGSQELSPENIMVHCFCRCRCH